MLSLCDTALGTYDAERDLCDTALGTYDAEQTNRVSSLLGSGVPAKCAVLGAVAAAHVLVRCPVSGVAYTEVCYSAYVKTSRSCDTASRAWDG